MGQTGGSTRPRGGACRHRAAYALLLTSVVGGCSLLPAEFNLAPIYRHRIDADGRVLELDVLWPLVHYETTPDGGTDFRIRPFYRRVERPELPGFGAPAEDHKVAPPGSTARRSDHQFLWPLGRVRSTDRETHARLFPLASFDARYFNDGGYEDDWYFLFPFFWGGNSEKAPDQESESYFGMFPLWLDAPGQFLTYDRFTVHLWPLHLRTEKDGTVGHTFLWPLIGFGGPREGEGTHWHRFLPFYNYITHPERFRRYSLLWPILSWGVDLLDTDDPLHGFAIWPLFSRQTSDKIHSWSVLWPFFRGSEIAGRKRELNLFWPLFHSLEDDTDGQDLRQWWFWPFVSRTTSRYQRAWSVLWPIIWWREYDDPDGRQNQEWIVPFYKHVHRLRKDGTEDDFLQVWPLFHDADNHDGTGDWSVPSISLWRGGNFEGVDEAYGWLWTLARGRRRAVDDEAMHLTANLYTTRTRGDCTQTSVPLLFSYEGNARQRTLYLFNLIPIPLGAPAGESQ